MAENDRKFACEYSSVEDTTPSIVRAPRLECGKPNLWWWAMAGPMCSRNLGH